MSPRNNYQEVARHQYQVTVWVEKQEHALTDASVSKSMTAGAATSLSS